MHIKAPLICSSEVESLFRAGADEFFCAVEDGNWRRLFRDLPVSQRRGKSNFQSFFEFERAVKKAHRLGAKVHAAINAFFYLPGQYKAAFKMIDRLIGAGADGIIFSDPVLLSSCRGLLKGKTAIIGCDGVVFNSASTAFFKELGAARVVFPREMTMAEMHAVVTRDRSMEYEAFIMNDLCFFIDGFCGYCKGVGSRDKKGRQYRGLFVVESTEVLSRGEDAACRSKYSRCRVDLKKRRIGAPTAFSYWPKKHVEGCGACAVYDLARIGVTSLKVLDRNLPLKERLIATRFIAKSVKSAASLPDKKWFFAQCRSHFKKIYGGSCSVLDCYYPDVLAGAHG